MDNPETRVRELNNYCRNTMIDHLGIEFTEVGNGMLKARMPVDHRTVQPLKRLHGGALMALAETLGSAGSHLLIDPERQYVAGIEINGNHVGTAASSFVTAVAKIVHQGRMIHVWEIRVCDENEKPVSICRMTNMVIDIREEKMQK